MHSRQTKPTGSTVCINLYSWLLTCTRCRSTNSLQFARSGVQWATVISKRTDLRHSSCVIVLDVLFLLLLCFISYILVMLAQFCAILLFLWIPVNARILALVLQLYERNKLKLKLKYYRPLNKTAEWKRRGSSRLRYLKNIVSHQYISWSDNAL